MLKSVRISFRILQSVSCNFRMTQTAVSYFRMTQTVASHNFQNDTDCCQLQLQNDTDTDYCQLQLRMTQTVSHNTRITQAVIDHDLKVVQTVSYCLTIQTEICFLLLFILTERYLILLECLSSVSSSCKYCHVSVLILSVRMRSNIWSSSKWTVRWTKKCWLTY